MHSIFPVILLAFSAGDDERFLNLIRSVEDGKGVFGFLENEFEVRALLSNEKSRQESFRFHYLMMLNNDIEKFKTLNVSGRADIVKASEIFLISNKISKANPISNEQLNDMTVAYKKLIAVFGPFSYVDLLVSTTILVNRVASFPEKNFADDIDAEIVRFEKSSWRGSPMLAHLYVIKCRNSINAKIYGMAYDVSLKIKKMHDEICSGLSDPIHLAPLSYEIQSLSLQGKYGEVIEAFKKIPKNLLDNHERKYLSGISRIYSSVSTSYLETGKIELAIIYQESALGKAYQCFLDRDYPVVYEQAVKLRSFLEKKGDMAAVRAIEERFNLKPDSK